MSSPKSLISSEIWNDPDFDDVTADGILVYFHFVTHNEGNSIGCFKISRRKASAECRMDESRWVMAVKELIDAGKIEYESESGWAWVRGKFSRSYNPGKPPHRNMICSVVELMMSTFNDTTFPFHQQFMSKHGFLVEAFVMKYTEIKGKTTNDKALPSLSQALTKSFGRPCKELSKGIARPPINTNTNTNTQGEEESVRGEEGYRPALPEIHDETVCDEAYLYLLERWPALPLDFADYSGLKTAFKDDNISFRAVFEKMVRSIKKRGFVFESASHVTNTVAKELRERAKQATDGQGGITKTQAEIDVEMM